MTSKLRRILVLAIALIMIFSLAACGPSGDDGSNNVPQKVQRSTAGNKVKSPADITYIVENPIKITYVNVFPNGETKPEGYPTPWEYLNMIEEDRAQYNYNDAIFNGQMIQISGLKDQEIEDKVNARIKEHFVEYIDFIPPYRGIKATIGENPQQVEEEYNYPTVNMWSTGSYNNILSINTYGYTTYEDPEGGVTEWGNDVVYGVSFSEPLNIDLNTGEEISFDSLFCDDIDPYEYTNAFMREKLLNDNADEEKYLEGNAYGDLKLVGQFTGIRPEQKFMVGPSGIILNFDYETPEFDMSTFYPAQVTMPLSEAMAVTQRFYDPDENIYESTEPAKKIFPYMNIDKEAGTIEIEDYNIGSTWVYLRAEISDNTPEVIKEKMLSNIDITDEAIMALLEPEYSEALLMHDPLNSVQSAFQRRSYTVTAGPFLNVNMNESIEVYEVGDADYQQYLSEYKAINEVYDLRNFDEKNPEPLGLEDLFYDDVDVEKVIKDAMWTKLNRDIIVYDLNEEYTNGEEVLEMTEQMEEYLDRVYHSITGFRIAEQQMYLYTDSTDYTHTQTSEDMMKEIFEVRSIDDIPHGYRIAYSLTTLDYWMLGYENICIFD